jgi:HSP20 family molecular chaperone IbpA
MMTDHVSVRKTSSILDEWRQMQNRVMRRAYDIFEHDGHPFGRDVEHWLQAEHELLWKPPIEIHETNGKLVMEAAISGVEPNDVNIEVTPEDIVLKAETQHQHDEKKGTVHVCEFESGSMFRSIHLPRRINPDNVKAELKNGLLRVTAEVAEGSGHRNIKSEAA